jgi:pimeloyl-ACP methyl ester carboxylesterase
MNDIQHSQKHSRGRGCLRLIGRGLAGLAVLIILLAVVGYVVEHTAAPRDMKRYPPPGQMIEVENHMLHLYCTGSGSPTVILEAAATSSSLDWGYVQPEIAKLTRVCSYDRAGFGWSELGDPPRTARRAAGELHTLLAAAGENGPFILVGASYGGHVVRVYAHDYPEEVSGLVLVDPRPEKFLSIPYIRKQSASSLPVLRAITLLGEVGVPRLMAATIPDKMIPLAAVPLYRETPGSYAIVFQSKLWYASYAEAQAMETNDEQVAAIGSLGSMPLIVIRHGKPMFGSLPASEAKAMEQYWQDFLEEIARQSSAGQIVVAKDSGHAIQLEQPSIIIDSVKQMMESD